MDFEDSYEAWSEYPATYLLLFKYSPFVVDRFQEWAVSENVKWNCSRSPRLRQ